ncbi:acyl-CoA synthetase [soil metagenome]
MPSTLTVMTDDAGVTDERARQAVTLLHRMGVGASDRVVVLADNADAVLALTWGALRAGIVPVPLNTALSDPQMAEMAADADARAIVIDEGNAGRLAAHLVLTDALLDGARPSADGLAPLPQARAMHYTSGTTGSAKGVWSGLLGRDLGRAWVEDERAANPTGPDDVHLVCSYLFHSGPHRYALNTLNGGGRVVVQPRFDAGATLAAIQRERVTTAFMVPTHLARMLDHPAMGTTDLSSLRWIHHAGAACPEPLKRRALRTFPDGVLHEFYGSTEGQFTAISPDEWLQRPGSVGRARTGRRLLVTEGVDGPEVDPGVIGTVWVSAPPHGRFAYWRDPAKTAAAWRGDLFTVGDLGLVDREGYLTLAGRRGDLIITGGVNVYPAEVERVLLAHPAVLEGVVYGLPDPRWGQQVTAAVIPRRGASADPEEIRSFLRQRLAGFQTPKHIEVVDDLPRTASGKVVRSRLTGA